MTTTEQVIIGFRIPVALKERITHYCERNGVKMGHFVTEALKDRLAMLAGEGGEARTAKAKPAARPRRTSARRARP